MGRQVKKVLQVCNEACLGAVQAATGSAPAATTGPSPAANAGGSAANAEVVGCISTNLGAASAGGAAANAGGAAATAEVVGACIMPAIVSPTPCLFHQYA